VKLSRHIDGRYLASLGVLIGALSAVGCGYSPSCPDASPANDPENWPVATKLDLPGVWQISYSGNLAIDEAFGWRSGLGDHFIAFDAEGNPKYEGVMAPGNAVAMWQWNLQTGEAAPSLSGAGTPDRTIAKVDVEAGSDGSISFQHGYREPFQRRTDLSDTDVVVLYERMRLNAAGDTLTGLRREQRTFVSISIPLPGVEENVWRVSLRRVDASIVPEPVTPDILADAVPRGGVAEPYPVGQVFDLSGTIDPSADAGTPYTRWVWVVYRTVLDDDGSILDRQHVAELEGADVTFTAEQAGTYDLRLWATDGNAWVVATTIELIVE